MRKRQVFIFLAIFFVVNGLVNFYIFLRGYEGLELHENLRGIYAALFLIVSNSYVVGRFLEKRSQWKVSDVFCRLGSFWFAFVLYFFLTVVLFDLIRLINIFGHFLPEGLPYREFKFYLEAVVIGITLLLCLAGYVNAKKIRVKKLEFIITKANVVANELTIAVASDIHLGTIIGKRWTRRIVNQINSLHPDLILLPGDIVAGDVEPVIKLNLGETLRQLKAKYGIYAITGNHEYIGGVEKAVKYIQ